MSARPLTLLKQAAILILGLLVAAVMVGLGIWQLNVYSSQGAHKAEARAAEAPIELLTVARPGQPVGDGYGRTVHVTGRYDPGLQVLIPLDGQPGAYRVLTALLLPSGGAIPVVRGVTDRASLADVPAPPVGTVRQGGVLLPSEPDTQRDPSLGGTLDSVQLPLLAQRWSPTLVNGFLTLDSTESRMQGLTAAPVALPQGQGRTQNAAYALQWWIFAAFALVMAVRMARDVGRRDDYEYAQSLDPDGGPDVNNSEPSAADLDAAELVDRS